MTKYVWGTGNYFEKIVNKYPDILQDIVLIDRDKNKIGGFIHGKKVEPPEILMQEKQAEAYVFICAENYKVYKSIRKEISTYQDIQYGHIDKYVKKVDPSHLVREWDTIEDNKKEIEARLQDEVTKAIFDVKWRGFEEKNPFAIYDVLFRLDRKNGTRLIREAFRFPAEQDIISILKKVNRERIVLVGIRAESAYMLKAAHVTPDAFYRRDDKTPDMFGLECDEISWDQCVREYRDSYFISGDLHDGEIRKKLAQNGIRHSHFLKRHTCWRSQYFDEEFLQPDHGVFIDAGALDMGSTLDYIQWCEGDYEKVYAFEPDSANFVRCQNRIKDSIFNNVELINAGVWENDGKVLFDNHGDGASKVVDKDGDEIAVRSIDSVLGGQRASYIKMDVEGSEIHALRGAKETIIKWRPKLAVCIYHKTDDIYVLTKYILSLVPDYKIYIRHYSTCMAETVMYCI